MSQAATAGAVIIGNEILTGKFHDQNTPCLIKELRSLGIVLEQVAIVRDQIDDIADTTKSFSERYDYVFTSGGIGPTHDDVTIEAIAKAFDSTLVRHPQLESLINGHWGDRVTEAHLRLAEVPEEAELIEGPDISFPTICVGNVFILPGVPELFARKLLSLKPRLRSHPVFTARIYLSAGESTIAASLAASADKWPNVELGSYPRFLEADFKVIVTLESDSPDALQQAFAALCKDLDDYVVRVEKPQV